MLDNRLITYFVPKLARSVQQFRIPCTDCVKRSPKRKVVDPKLCHIRDRGLVLGVYYNENISIGESAILTASAQKMDRKTGGKLWKLLKLAPMPRLGEHRVFFDLDSDYAFVAVAGLGSECLSYNETEQLDESKEAIRIAAGVGSRALQEMHPRHIDVESFGNAEAAAEGAALATWQFREYRAPDVTRKIPIIRLHLHDDCDYVGWKMGMLKAEAQNLARFLQEMPANLLNPTSFAKLAVDLLCELDINVHVKTQGWAASREMGGFVGIGKSSVQPPLFVEIGYFGGGPCSRPVVLIGKGVTFDSGSLDLKSAKELKYMRGDMAGAACVLAVTRAAARLKLPINIRGILPLCEIMPSGRSPKFGDVFTGANGKSIHLRLPSKEGRLVIADSLLYARKYWPQFIVDVGTMSKELLDTLGGAACGYYTNSEQLMNYTQTASSHTGDRIWRMPLWKYYENRVLNCSTCDVANTAHHQYGDSPNCAAFLKQFVCDSQWMHFDTYNIMYSKGHDFAYLGRGMTGRPTRTIIELMCQLVADSKL
ncbi:cytosol aminopeptidase-like [Plodia interpunctella]|uniref:cytosol aminopeptidase-like n=1 Tax=Plodia interpunctella TaxID=58824 RepID=UPI0031018E39